MHCLLHNNGGHSFKETKQNSIFFAKIKIFEIPNKCIVLHHIDAFFIHEHRGDGGGLKGLKPPPPENFKKGTPPSKNFAGTAGKNF
jgi:hypothetical protein